MLHAYLTGLGDFRTDSYEQNNSGVTWFMFLLATIVVQLIFMNLLIAIMGESFGRINEIIEQSTLKELCVLMDNHDWLLDIKELYKDKRYILWLTPDTTAGSGTNMERGLASLGEEVKDLQTMLEKTMSQQ